MSIEVKKSQFKDDGAGGLVIHAHLSVTKSGKIRQVLQDKTFYNSSDSNVATVTEDPADKTKIAIAWVGEGPVTINSNSDDGTAENPEPVTASLELSLVDDSAPKAELILDL